MDRREYYIIPFQKQVTLTIWILAKSESCLAVGDRFGMSASSAHYCFQNMFASLIDTYIKWPNAAYIENITDEFETRSGIPGVIDIIDTYHIPMMQPHYNAVDYYNRKGFHNVYIGAPGRVHDARVLRNSPLYKNIMNHNLILPDTHLIGDSAYPLSTFLLVPFKDNDHITVEQMRYNTKFSSIQ
ncbi:Putative nuclease HARBI1 [Trachymyrmex cornetzi]|uniref:Putative nuclease HARBI1 n=1 Tax=Trachymyrmex cornetzi TaxID=471704 RepID=A0A151JMX5_9HYME|nr:Putative nuclease HARBI1 [Trachymyrmex cornetzi]